MRIHGIPPESGELLSLFRKDQPLKRHSAYRAAKAGDPAAAAQLVGELAAPLVGQVKKFGADALFVAPHAVEASGENAIPQMLAGYLAQKTGARDDIKIVQRNKVYHTGADAMQRLIAPSEFTGEVEAHALYVLVDDVSTMGGTLSDLASYILTHGGRVIGCAVLVNAARSGKVIPSPQDSRAVEEEIRR